MASSGNFPVWTNNVKGATNLSLGGTRFDGSTSSRSAVIPFHVPTGTKFYVELLVKQATNYNIVFGLVNPYQAIDTYLESQSTVNGMIFHGYSGGDWRTNALVNGSRQGFGALDDDSTSARVMAMTINRVDNEIKMYLDNTLISNGTISISATEDYTIFASFTGGSNSAVHMNINCGHDSTGAGDFSAASNADENGFGEFQYSPPSGFLAICSANLPIPSDIDPAETDDDFPQKQCGVVTYTGDGSARTISGLGFQPDLIWAKTRNTTSRHYLVDSSRGFTKYLHSEDTYSEGTSSTGVTSANSDGFVIGGGLDYVNYSGRTFVAWCWRANGGTTASNSDGAISSTVQANQAAGFSIVQWTANATSSVATTVGHGLSKAPEFVITKSRESSTNWCVTHIGLSSTSHMLFLNTNATETDKSGNGNMSANTSTVFSVNATDGSNAPNGDNMIAYCWHSVDGFSKFGKYDGNANADGSFIYTGFRPRILIIRVLGVASDGWLLYDTERETFNPLDTVLKPHDEAADYSASAFRVDILSNGFKLRSSDNAVNGTSYDPYIYMAWADVPFKYNNAF